MEVWLLQGTMTSATQKSWKNIVFSFSFHRFPQRTRFRSFCILFLKGRHTLGFHIYFEKNVMFPLSFHSFPERSPCFCSVFNPFLKGHHPFGSDTIFPFSILYFPEGIQCFRSVFIFSWKNARILFSFHFSWKNAMFSFSFYSFHWTITMFSFNFHPFPERKPCFRSALFFLWTNTVFLQFLRFSWKNTIFSFRFHPFPERTTRFRSVFTLFPKEHDVFVQFLFFSWKNRMLPFSFGVVNELWTCPSNWMAKHVSGKINQNFHVV